MAVRQETDYPTSGKVLLTLEPSAAAGKVVGRGPDGQAGAKVPAGGQELQSSGRQAGTTKSRPASGAYQFALRLRIPAWCREAKVEVNGEAATGPVRPGTFYAISRAWRPGDRVELEMPMPLRLVRGRQSQVGRVAVMRGPMLFGLGRERNPAVAQTELRLMTVDPESLEGPMADHGVRPGGMACRIRAWKPAGWYPHANPEYRLTLTEFADPAVELVYFHVPNPSAKEFCDDELTDVPPPGRQGPARE